MAQPHRQGLPAQPACTMANPGTEIPKCRLLAKSPDCEIMPLITYLPSYSSSSWIMVFLLLKDFW